MLQWVWPLSHSLCLGKTVWEVDGFCSFFMLRHYFLFEIRVRFLNTLWKWWVFNFCQRASMWNLWRSIKRKETGFRHHLSCFLFECLWPNLWWDLKYLWRFSRYFQLSCKWNTSLRGARRGKFVSHGLHFRPFLQSLQYQRE